MSSTIDTIRRVVTIVVGQDGAEQRSFQIHADKLKENSGSCEARLPDSVLSGAATPTIRLPNIRPRIFARFSEFVYSELLETGIPRPGETRDMLDSQMPNIELSQLEICEAWLAGADLGAAKFQNECLRTWNIKMAKEQKYDFHEIKFVWERTRSRCPLRTFLVDAYSRADCDELFNANNCTDDGYWPHGFLYRLCRRTLRKKRSRSATKEYYLKREVTPYLTRKSKSLSVMDIDSD